MQVTNGSVTLELQQATKKIKVKQRSEVTGRKVTFIEKGHFYAVHDDGTYEIFGDVFPANGWSEVGVAKEEAPVVEEEALAEEAPVVEEEAPVVEETVVEEAVEEAPAPAKKPRKRLGRRR